MALLDLALGSSKISYIDTNVEQTESSLLALGVASADTVVYFGDGDFKTTDFVGVGLLSGGYTVVTGGAHVTTDAGLLDLSLLTAHNVVIDGDSHYQINAAGVAAGGLVTDIFNRTKIAFSGNGGGTFTYVPPTIGVLDSVEITIDEMAYGDKVVIPYPGNGLGGVNALREDTGLFGLSSPYKNGYLHLQNGFAGLSEVTLRIKMSQEEYDRYRNDKDAYLDGPNDTFTFPGVPPTDGDDYEVPCFTRGVMIETPSGLVAVEDLAVGDLVMTKDNGAQPIRWISSRVVGTMTLLARPNLCPIRVKAGALGNNTPAVDMLLSPQHRVMVRSSIAQKMFGADEVLVAVKQLLQLDGIDIVSDFKPVEYFHFLCDQHDVVYANGAEAETLYPGPMALKAVGAAAYEEICTLFPEIANDGHVPASAREMPSGRMARKLAVFHKQAGMPLNS